MGDEARLSDLSDEEQESYVQLANRFLEIANDRFDDGPVAYTAATFLYACARYNGFAMQAQGAVPGEVRPETVDYLVGCFRTEVEAHMQEALGAEPDQEAAPAWFGAAIEVEIKTHLAHLAADEALEEGQAAWRFDEVADAYITLANELAGAHRISRLSSTMMHACSRYAVYAMQAAGLAPEIEDRATSERMVALYADTLRAHLGEVLVHPQA
ncbi:MAG: DUF3144 domain-containing protein [Pseudomonadota bacterium]